MATKNHDLKEKILALLKNYTLSTREISQEIGATYATTLKHLEILLASSKIENEVYGKTKVWSIKKANPFELDLNTVLYRLIIKLRQEFQSDQILVDLLRNFYHHAIESTEKKFKYANNVMLIQRYLELEHNLKWKHIEGYDILDEDDIRNINIKIYDCKYKFGCCADLKEENQEILCILGQKFQVLLKLIGNHDYEFELIDFSLVPSTCTILLKNKE